MDNAEPATEVEINEAILIGDDQLVKVFIKMRTRIAELNEEYAAAIKVVKDQQQMIRAELLHRFQARGSTQTKTQHGTAFIKEEMSITIADESAYGAFVLAENDWSYYQKRAKVERVREYMKEHDGALPPGLSVFRELDINVRVPAKKATKSKGEGGPTEGSFWEGDAND
jgi:hypothetical protein